MNGRLKNITDNITFQPFIIIYFLIFIFLFQYIVTQSEIQQRKWQNVISYSIIKQVSYQYNARG